MRQRRARARVTMPLMTEDAHAQANAEQVRVLREALAGTEEVGAETGDGAGDQHLAPTCDEDSPLLP